MDALAIAARELGVNGRDLPWLLSSWAQRAPEKPFLVWAPFSGEDRSWSYGEFERDARRVANALASLGVGKGHRVLIHLDNSPEFLLSYFGCAYLGAVAVTTNTRSVERDVAYFAEHAEVIGALTQPKYAALVQRAAPQLAFVAVTDNDAGEAVPAFGEESITRGSASFESLLAEKPLTERRAADPHLELAIQFTSGTTSRPKAVVWTHANALWGAQCNARHFGLRHDDVCQAFLPLFHTNNQSYSLLGSLWVGGTYVLQPRFSARNFWSPALKYGATWASMIPFCASALSELSVPDHTFRFWAPAVTLSEVETHFRVRTLGLWGMTETITQGIVSDFDHPEAEMAIGRPSPGYEISVRGPDGTPVAAGETGDLFIRGVRGISLFKEYLNDADANAASFDDAGWFKTGDRLRIGEDGTVFFADRAKDMLKVGGENVAASEIEAVILESGWVSECAVVGQQHPMLDEVPVAFVIAHPDAGDRLAEKLIAYSRERLADFKALRAVYIVDDLPRATLEKIAKNVLRDQLPVFVEPNSG